MPVITKALLNDEKALDEARVALSDITRTLDLSRDDRRAVKIISAAYVLYHMSRNESLQARTYREAAQSNDYMALGEGAFREYISENDWGMIKGLSSKHSPEAYAIAAMTADTRSYDRQGFDVHNDIGLPDSLVKLASALLDIKNEDRVADLCCGQGSFLTSVGLEAPDLKGTGFEINIANKTIASIRSELVGANLSVQLRDVFSLPEDETCRFDKVFANYPFGLRLQFLGLGSEYLNRIAQSIPGISKATSSDWIFNYLACELMTDDGKAAAIMTNGGTWNTIDRAIRQHFVENGLIEAIISLPSKLFTYTGIATSLIVFSHNNSRIRMIDASHIFHEGRRANEITEDDVAAILHGLTVDTDYSRIIGIDLLRDNDYVLNPGRYFEKPTQIKDAKPFGEVIKSITRGAPCNASQLDAMSSDKATPFQYLMLSSIQNGIIDDQLPYLKEIEPKLEKYCVHDGDLVMSKNGYPYKIAVAKVSDGQTILGNGNLFIIELDREKAEPLYVKAFFESDMGVAALKSITVGTTLPNIGLENLKKLEISLPPIEEQRRIAMEYQMILDEIAVYRLKTEKAMDRLHHLLDSEREG